MKRIKSVVMIAATAVLAVAAILPAQPTSAVTSSALSINPRKDYVIEPGDSVKDKLVIRNLDQNNPLKLTLRVIDFTYSDNSGTPKFFLAEDAPQTTWSLKPFLNLPEQVTVNPNSSKSIDLQVSIPEGHGAGSYYSAIMYASGTAGEGNGGLSASGMTLVFATIPGDVDEQLTLKGFGAYQPRRPDQTEGYKFLNIKKPNYMAYTLENSGNVTEAPSGSIVLRDMFGNEYKIDDANPSDSLALIGQTRTFLACIKLKAEKVNFQGDNTEADDCIEPELWPGLYTATLDLYYGHNGNTTKTVHDTARFLYLPVWFIVVSLIVLALIAYFARRIILFFRSRSRKSKLGRRRRR